MMPGKETTTSTRYTTITFSNGLILKVCMCRLLCMHTYSHVCLLDHADIVGSVSDRQGDGSLWGRLEQMHHLNPAWNKN